MAPPSSSVMPKPTASESFVMWKELFNRPPGAPGIADIMEECRQLVVAKGVGVNCVMGYKQTPLHLAAKGTGMDGDLKVKVIQWLIMNGADPRAKDLKGNNFLHVLVGKSVEPPTPSQYHSLAKFLAGKGRAGLFAVGDKDWNRTPLHLAMYKLDLEESTLELLAKKKVDFHSVDRLGNNVITHAVMGRRSVGLIDFLVEKFKVKWDRRNENGNSILHFAAQEGTLETLEFFLDKDCLDVNEEDGDGDTPLHCAAKPTKAWEMMGKFKLLIERGASTLMKNRAGDTALKIARMKHTEGDVAALKKWLEDRRKVNAAKRVKWELKKLT